MVRKFAAFLLILVTATATTFGAPKKTLFFTKSSGFEHSVISWKKGQPSWAEGCNVFRKDVKDMQEADVDTIGEVYPRDADDWIIARWLEDQDKKSPS